MSPIGQTFRTARPTIVLSPMGPNRRESQLATRLSPMTKTIPAGTWQVSETAGVVSQPGITWALAVSDVDLDGDADLVFADDQCAFPHSGLGGIEASSSWETLSPTHGQGDQSDFSIKPDMWGVASAGRRPRK